MCYCNINTNKKVTKAFLFRKAIMLTTSDECALHFADIGSPALENNCSVGQDDAGIQKNVLKTGINGVTVPSSFLEFFKRK